MTLPARALPTEDYSPLLASLRRGTIDRLVPANDPVKPRADHYGLELMDDNAWLRYLTGPLAPRGANDNRPQPPALASRPGPGHVLYGSTSYGGMEGCYNNR